MLVAAGALAPGNRACTVISAQRNCWSQFPAAGQVIVRRYARWAVTRVLHQRVADRAVPTAALIRWPLAKIRIAAEFTTALSGNGQAMHTVTQAQIGLDQ